MKLATAKISIREVPQFATFGYNEERKVFGVVEHGQMSFIAYYLDDYFIPKRVVARSRANGGNFFLHVGMRMIVTADELERVFKEFELW